MSNSELTSIPQANSRCAALPLGGAAPAAPGPVVFTLVCAEAFDERQVPLSRTES